MPRNLIIAVLSVLISLPMVSCHHPAPAPYIDPAREITAPDIPQQSAKAPTPKLDSKTPVEAFVPATCLSDLDQSEAECHLVAKRTDLARCDNVLIHFACLSYRNQEKTKPAQTAVPAK